METKSSKFFGSVKNPPAMQETLVQSLGQEDPLEKKMTTHSSILAWKIPWPEESGRLQFIGSQKSQIGLNRRHKDFLINQRHWGKTCWFIFSFLLLGEVLTIYK